MSNGVRQGGVLSLYLFAFYLDDLSNELNNIKIGCYVGEVVLNHLMFADDICVLFPSVRRLQRILDVCQAYAKSHGIIFNCTKAVCMTFKAKSAKSEATPLLKLGGQYVKSVDQYKIWGLYWIQSSQMTKTFRDNCDINIVQQTSCETLFPDVQMHLKAYFFVPFVRPCMHHNYGGISGSHACRDCVKAYNFGCRATGPQPEGGNRESPPEFFKNVCIY